jgi:alpha-L-fucosidase
VVPERTRDTEKIAENSQQQDDDNFRQRKISACDLDLGSRDILAKEDKLIWYPAEVNTSIRPGWFYHESEDDQVKSLSQLIKIYENSVGGNATFLLNIPPNKDGLFHENDIKRLYELGEYIKKTYSDNLLDTGCLKASCGVVGHEIDCVRTDGYDTCFRTQDGECDCSITISWEKEVEVGHIVLKENILLSQRVESFLVQARIDGKLETIYEGTVIGYKKIIAIKPLRTSEIQIHIQDARVAPTLSFLGVY